MKFGGTLTRRICWVEQRGGAVPLSKSEMSKSIVRVYFVPAAEIYCFTTTSATTENLQKPKLGKSKIFPGMPFG